MKQSGRAEISIYTARFETEKDITEFDDSFFVEAVFDQTDGKQIPDVRAKVREQAQDIVREVIERIDDDEPYGLAREAAAVLDQAEVSVAELEQLLMEYKGRPIYTGDCQYLDEAEIQ